MIELKELKEYKPEDLKTGEMYVVWYDGDYVLAFWEVNMFDSPDIGWLKDGVKYCAGPLKEIK